MCQVRVILETVEPDEETVTFLYRLLEQREPHENISHQKMPSMEEHRRFIDGWREIYLDWLIICLPYSKQRVGSIYLTHRREIGVHLVSDWRRRGIGSAAVKALMASHGAGVYFANIAPSNYRSQDFFEHHGFRIIQYTYKLDWSGEPC